ncbi:recombination regulator RecX [Avibacterium paragallinarum]|uniref:Regulatory protein RecX n=1 Tax=Avibacterium paragallinarum TaxID=728 RepID=A0A377I6C9_AVIPA|nr:recombination regulator RecX [Avibacterium paragallinarum]POY45554.1 recombination regulator RecX [Avibacterium paragallinarum]RZN75671.1 recombination regulator RecX [Avibacterium paragallinarum]CDF97786.1 Putative Regulatory protein RecX [Avibacterium paragallinarum JF4211]STO70824.1 regulatory protein for RecA [Avibacterium paragallinarum]
MASLALNYVVNLLARREYSEYELRCKMQEKAFSEEEIEQALRICQEKNWQSDRRFTENYLHYQSQKGFGLNRIKQELFQLKGIASEVVEEVVAESEIDWFAVAHSVLRKKFPHYAQEQDFKMKQKIWRYMLSHGFQSEEFADFVGAGEENF